MLFALVVVACSRSDAPLFGVRLGDAMSTARDHLVTPGQGAWESEAGKVPALTWTPVSPSSPLKSARLEFHKGALVAARYLVSPDAKRHPEAGEDGLSFICVGGVPGGVYEPWVPPED